MFYATSNDLSNAKTFDKMPTALEVQSMPVGTRIVNDEGQLLNIHRYVEDCSINWMDKSEANYQTYAAWLEKF